MAIRGSIATPIRVAIHVAIHIAVDIDIRVVTSAPTPPVSPITVIRNNRAARHADPETYSSTGEGVIRGINITWIGHWITTINDRRVILRDIHDIGL